MGKAIKIQMALAIPSEDQQGNQVDIETYTDNWKEKFGELHKKFTFTYEYDDGTGKDEILNEDELDEAGFDIEDIRQSMRDAHSYAIVEESSYI